jgi:hypothetical protein
LRTIRIQAGNHLEFETIDSRLVPKNPAAAMVLQLFMHKGEVDNDKQDIVELLNGAISIEQLSNELVVAKQFAEAKRIAMGKQEEAREI